MIQIQTYATENLLQNNLNSKVTKCSIYSRHLTQTKKMFKCLKTLFLHTHTANSRLKIELRQFLGPPVSQTSNSATNRVCEKTQFKLEIWIFRLLVHPLIWEKKVYSEVSCIAGHGKKLSKKSFSPGLGFAVTVGV